jgi:hypothetical protein
VTGERALVPDGVGIAGLRWLAGLIRGLFEKGVDLREADRMIGTSAGAAMGANPLDPAIRIPSAEAGLAQAVAVAGQVNSFWNGNSKYLLGHVFDTF